ncbi:MAG: hypothetical protein A2268_04405 [Candidatus Raymondbacteria bacterium RifOxyA12_full_50_37]|uniref:FecR protein domain-containing protein n=1 Tax=Candidatus Raymondbacteria bacterium RIFOXYD12_FULL_49_13 TaxID=1817890 RepID=A0A1F7FB40_UNCRA|nr:MAG: hypothetical protein A2268_04405 [Candidatus Raymondbacteria bacterium RifOxyA12_full_50_37]OGJ87709.1 MAG: hypothetical protein A2350_13650 [Candidatus Raymondbacteria bacterium RifOxyB12_full_50_8]OGJ92536.1 MAG: hypothetical protein A2248_05545 [Candidatus Raymondbacteria bacterium RIFOXYA2_FULL_49_16]OGJ97890.1 MAG: hypothetical protein A2453_02570 [Candidatus Raymondbacteria bacterium RIFOXYC2_FULL_50_21]OGK03831.1 MAG: hypothetical protein A2519_02245 [Candidatus Raymondbacteria b
MKILNRVSFLSLLFFIAIFISAAFSQQLKERGATLKFYVGKVMVKSDKEKEWREVKIGLRLKSRDAIRTFVESRADVETSEGSVITISENTVFELSELSSDSRTKADNTKLSVKTGSILANVKKLTNTRSSFVFETPTATAAIRGTELGVNVQQGRTVIQVREGSVEVSSKSGGKPVFVFTNQQATVNQGTAGVNVQAISGAPGQQGSRDIFLDITSPEDDAVLSSNVVALAGKTVPGAVIKVSGGADIIPGADGSFASSYTFPENAAGEQQITFTAIKDGLTATKTKKVVLGGAAPKTIDLAIESPVEGATTTSNTIDVAGTATPDATVALGDGQVITVSGTGSFSASYKLPSAAPGNYQVTFTAKMGALSKSLSVNVSIIETPKELALIINAPAEGEEFVKINKIPVRGITLPGAIVTFGSGAKVTADASGNFAGLYELPRTFGEHTLAITATAKGQTQKAMVKVRVSLGDNACDIEITEPSSNADVDPVFTVKGNTTNPAATIKINGTPATVTGTSFSATVNSGFGAGQDQPLTLTVTEPRNSAKLIKLPVIIRGKVTPALAKVLIDGVKEARVFSDGTFECEYPMSDETGDYDVEVSAILESGADVRKKFDIIVESSCNGVTSAPIRVPVNVNAGASQRTGEKKSSVSFRYEKQKYDLVLLVAQPKCVAPKIVIEVKTNAVELRANDKIVPLSGAGGTIRSYNYEIINTDKACFQETEVVFTAADEAANPENKEISVTWTCPLVNTEKPELQVQEMADKLSIKVFDRSFLCPKADEEVQVTVQASGEGQIDEFDVTTNGATQLVNYVDGVNIQYTIKAKDKGGNTVTKTLTKAGFISKQPYLRPLSPATWNSTRIQRILPPPPPGSDAGAEEISIAFRIEGVEDYRLVKRVEFWYDGGSKSIYENTRIPSDLEFDDLLIPYSQGLFRKKGDTKKINFHIRVIDITDREKLQDGSITITGR